MAVNLVEPDTLMPVPGVRLATTRTGIKVRRAMISPWLCLMRHSDRWRLYTVGVHRTTGRSC